jgi:hypothetical protein
MSNDGLTIMSCLRAMSARLSDALAITRAAVTCAESGSEHEAVKIVLDLDQHLHDATTLHNAVFLLRRVKDWEASSGPPPTTT